jgi:GT2 family glycosyltransferase
MKVGLAVTVHKSSINPTGHTDLLLCINTFKRYIDHEYSIFIIDNSSDENLQEDFRHTAENYTYIDDQLKAGGLTGAWNFAVKQCYDDGCDIILNSNEDVEFRPTINSFINKIFEHKDNDVGLYGPITSRSGLSTSHQARSIDDENDNIIEMYNYALNGFFLGFTRDFYTKFNQDGNIFSTQKRDMWGGQEVELHSRNTPMGMRSFIVENSFIHHKKHRSWSKR